MEDLPENAERTAPEHAETTAPEPLVDEQAEAAAAEAGAIGGRGSGEDLDPADRPLAEAGQGYAEGFEAAEDDLIEGASHGDASGDPTRDAFSGEVESDRSTAVHGEPDEIDPTEQVEDPEEGPEDPGAGPGIAAER